MERFQHSTTISPTEVAPVASLSMQDYLYSLARTPNPKRFDRQRQLLLEGRPRLTRVRRILQEAGSSTSIEAGSSQGDQAPIEAVTIAQSRLDSEHIGRPLNHEPDTLTLEQTIRMARLALINPGAGASREEVDETANKNNIYGYHLSENPSTTPVTSPTLSDIKQYQDSAGDTSMFASAYAIGDDEEGSKHIKSLNLRHGRRSKMSVKSSIHSEGGGILGPFPDFEHDTTHGERIRIENSTPNILEHLSVQPPQKSAPLSTRKLRRPDRKQLRTYVNRNPLVQQQPARKIRMPRRLAVNKFELFLDRFPSNQPQHSDAETTKSDDDPIQNFSSSPFRGSSRAGRRHKQLELVNKRRPLKKLQQNLFKLDAVDVSEYKLPNVDGMSPNTKKRLKTSMTCSDGFEGRESQPTGRTMPMRLPRRHPQFAKQPLTRIPELSLTSSRSSTEITENARRMEAGPFEFDAITKLYHEGNDTMTDTFNPFMRQGPGLLEDRNKIYMMGEISQLNDSATLSPLMKRDDFPVEEAAVVTTPRSPHRLKHRVTFNEEVKVLQALMMISAPIAISNPCDSDGSEQGPTDDEDDNRTISESSDADVSDEDTQGASDDNIGAEDGNRNADEDAKDDGAHKRSPTCFEATFQSPRDTENCLEVNVEDALNSQRLARSDELVRGVKSICNGRTQRRICSPDLSYAAFPTGRGGESITGECRHKQKTTGNDSWRSKKPMPSNRLVEVDDDSVDYPDSPKTFLGGDEEMGPLRTADARKLGVQSDNGYNPHRTQASCKYGEGPQEGKQSQASIELGNPNWSVPYGSEDEESYSQVQNPYISTEGCHRYVVEEYPTYLARALDNFSSSSQGAFNLARSKSLPLNNRFHYVDQQVQEDHIAGKIEINPAFKHTVSPLTRSLSQMQSNDLRTPTRRMSIKARTSPIRGRIQLLSFNSSVLRDQGTAASFIC